MTRWVVLTAGALAALAALPGCDEKKSQANVAPTASSLAPATPAPAAMTMKFAVDPKSTTTLLMEGPLEKIKARTDGAAGTLDVDLKAIDKSRGEVKIDLTTFTTSTFGDKSKDETQTGDARTWLEVADGSDGKIDPKTKEQNRYAVYAIRAIENASATDVTKVAPVKDGADEVRTVTLTTKGELLIHGHKVERDADVELAFRYDPGAAPDKPKALAVKTKKPFRVVIAEHDIKPRDSFGKIAKGAFHLLGTKVADNADVTLDLRAKPQS